MRRNPRAAVMRYFRTRMKSAEPQLRAAGAFDERELPSVWAARDAVEEAADGLFCYTMSKLEARVVQELALKKMRAAMEKRDSPSGVNGALPFSPR